MAIRAPSLKRLKEAFPSIDPANLKRVRIMIQKGNVSLGSLDKLMETFGVEYIRNAKGEAVAAYLNSGDTYAPTLLRRYDSGRINISTMGDFVETYERNHAKLP